MTIDTSISKYEINNSGTAPQTTAVKHTPTNPMHYIPGLKRRLAEPQGGLFKNVQVVDPHREAKLAEILAKKKIIAEKSEEPKALLNSYIRCPRPQKPFPIQFPPD